MTTEPRRQHRSAIVGNGLVALRDAAVPLILAFVAGVGTSERSGGSALAYAAFGAVVAIAIGYRQWATTTWWVGPDGVHLRSGMFSTSETIVPRARIQSIDTSQNPLQRTFGTLSVQVQAAGGGAAAEIVIGSATPEDARQLRAAVGLGEPSLDAEPPVGVERMTLGVGALLLAALTAPQFGVLLPVVAAAATVGDELFFAGLREGWYRKVRLDSDLMGGALLVALVAWVLSMLAVVVAFAGFTVERDGERLRIRRGLAQRRAASLSLSRVHGILVVEGTLRQPLGLVSLRLETAAHRNEPATAQTLFPLLRRRDLETVLSRLVPELAGALGPLSPPPRRALASYVLPGAAAGVLVAVLCAWLRPGLLPLAAAVVVLAAGHGLARHRAAGWRLVDGRVLLRRRDVARRTLIASVPRLQEHSVAQTLLQRRRDLASLELAVASGRRARVAHLDARVAGQVFSCLAGGRGAVGAGDEPPSPPATAREATAPSAPMDVA